MKNGPLTIEWTIRKGNSDVREDFSRANLRVWLVSCNDKILLEREVKDCGLVVCNVPGDLEDGVYGVKALWEKDGYKRHYAEKKEVFAITNGANEGKGTPVLRFTSSAATYGYDGLSAYELACLKGATVLSESAWVANVEEMNQKEAELMANEEARQDEEQKRVEAEQEREQKREKLEEQIAAVQQSQEAIDIMLNGGSDRRELSLPLTHYAPVSSSIPPEIAFSANLSNPGELAGLGWMTDILKRIGGVLYTLTIDKNGKHGMTGETTSILVKENGSVRGVLAANLSEGSLYVTEDTHSADVVGVTVTKSGYVEHMAKFTDASPYYLTAAMKLNDGDVVESQKGVTLYRLDGASALASNVMLEVAVKGSSLSEGFYCLMASVSAWSHEYRVDAKVQNANAKGVYEHLEDLDEALANEAQRSKDKDNDLQGQISGLSIKKVVVPESSAVLDEWQMYDSMNRAVGAPIRTYKDQFIKNIEIVSKQGKDWMRITYSRQGMVDSVVEFDVSSLLVEAEFKEGLQVTDGKVSVKLSKDSVSAKYLKIASDGSVEISGIEAYMNEIESERETRFQEAETDRETRFQVAESHRQEAETLREEAEGNRETRFQEAEATREAVSRASSNHAKEQGDYAKEQGDYAKAQGEAAAVLNDKVNEQGSKISELDRKILYDLNIGIDVKISSSPIITNAKYHFVENQSYRVKITGATFAKAISITNAAWENVFYSIDIIDNETIVLKSRITAEDIKLIIYPEAILSNGNVNVQIGEYSNTLYEEIESTKNELLKEIDTKIVPVVYGKSIDVDTNDRTLTIPAGSMVVHGFNYYDVKNDIIIDLKPVTSSCKRIVFNSNTKAFKAIGFDDSARFIEGDRTIGFVITNFSSTGLFTSFYEVIGFNYTVNGKPPYVHSVCGQSGNAKLAGVALSIVDNNNKINIDLYRKIVEVPSGMLIVYNGIYKTMAAQTLDFSNIGSTVFIIWYRPSENRLMVHWYGYNISNEDIVIGIFKFNGEKMISSFCNFEYIVNGDICKKGTSINDLNITSFVEEKLIQMKRAAYNGKDVLSLLWFSDIHAVKKSYERISLFNKSWNTYIDDAICTGDLVSDKFEDSFDFWTDPSILVCIGNHDASSLNDHNNGYFGNIPGHYLSGSVETYHKYMKNIENWNVVQPENASQLGCCYYYKDYINSNVRLIVMDDSHYGFGDDMINGVSRQNLWIKQSLEDARNKGIAVVIAKHYPTAELNLIECPFNTCDVPDYIQTTPYQEIVNTVKEFIDNGGEFICYISGHMHTDLFGLLAEDNRQLVISMDTSRPFDYNVDRASIEGTKTADLFNIISFDTTSKLIKLARIGVQYDRYMRKKDTLCYDYMTKNIIK